MTAAPELAGRWLVVDDNPSDRRSMERVLVEAGVAPDDIVAVEGVGGARRAVLAGDIAGVLLDVSPPDVSPDISPDVSAAHAGLLDGVSVMSTMLPHVPLVVVTARPVDTLASAVLAQGADEYVTKVDLTAATLRDALARAQGRRVRQRRRTTTAPGGALDRFHAPAVTVDGSGRIVTVNTAWREAALAGGAASESVGPGVDYLALCDGAVGEHADGAREAAAGIRSVLHGAAERFRLEYPCPVGTDPTWWDLRVTGIGDSDGGAIITHVDITEIRAAELELSGRPELVRPVLDDSEVLFLLVDRRHRVSHVSELMRALTRLQPGELVDIQPGDFLDPDEGQAFSAAYRRVSAVPGASERVLVRLVDRDGLRRKFDLSIANRLDDPAVGAIVVTGADVTVANTVRVVGRLRDRLLDLLPTAVTVVDDVGTIIYCSPRTEVVLGRDPAELIGRSITDVNLLPLEAAQIEAIRTMAETSGSWTGDIEVRHQDGSTMPVQLVLERIDDDEVGFHGTVGISFDITERRMLEMHLDFEAGHDSLTGLFNRQRFVEFLDRALIEADETGRRIAVVFVDLDDFRSVNNSFGHAAGDALLAAMGAQFRAVLPAECVAARFGGDEFVFFCPDIHDEEAVVELARRLLEAIAQPIGSDADSVGVSASAGIAMSSPGVPAEDLLRRSDAAMYAAKDGGKNRIEVFDDAVGHRRVR